MNGGLLSRLVRLPGRILIGAKEFVDPSLKAGRLPFARTVLILQLIAALIFVGYTFTKKQLRVPFSPEPYLVDVVLPDAAGLDPSKEPAAGVAGAQAGKVIEVREENGKAIATLRFDSDMEGKIFADAEAQVRPINVLQVLIVNVLPGTPEAGPLPDDEPIPAERTDTFVHIDELTSILDADTQSQIQILISELATAFRGREPQLRKILLELGETVDTATPLAEALGERRRLLRRLVDNLDTVFTSLGERGDQLRRTIDAGSRTLAVTTARESELAAATRELGPTLAEANNALRAARGLAGPLGSALDQLVPVSDDLGPAATKLREIIPTADSFLDLTAELVSEAKRPVKQFKQGTKGLAGRVKRDLIPAIDDFGVTIAALDKFKTGIAQTADLWSAAFSVNANGGPYTQTYVGNAEIDPSLLGLTASAARSRGNRPSELSMLLAEALERTCREENTLGCVWRYALPDLPEESVIEPEGAAGIQTQLKDLGR